MSDDRIVAVSLLHDAGPATAKLVIVHLQFL